MRDESYTESQEEHAGHTTKAVIQALDERSPSTRV